MKRGQLTAVIVIVLLVAAVAGFLIFSQKKAGRATLVLSQPQTQQDQNVMAIPIPLGFQPGPLKQPTPTPQPIPPSQSGPPGTTAQPQPPAPKPPAPAAGATETSAEKTECDEGISTIPCYCTKKGAAYLRCSKDLFARETVPIPMPKTPAGTHLEADARLGAPDVTEFGCTAEIIAEFSIVRPGDWCFKGPGGLGKKSWAECIEAATGEKKDFCAVSESDKAKLDALLDTCVTEIKSTYCNGITVTDFKREYGGSDKVGDRTAGDAGDMNDAEDIKKKFGLG